MNKLFNIFLSLVLGIGVLSAAVLPSYAQMDDDLEVTDDWDWGDDWGDDWWDDNSWETDSTYTYEGPEELEALFGGLGLLAGGIAMIISFGMFFAVYIFSALALMGIAKKLDHPNGWFAWIPILNAVLLFQMGDKSPWLLLIGLIPGLGALILLIISILVMMTICEKRGYDKLLGLLVLVPLGNLILLGVLAWGKK
jgi:hypothetical protein